MLSWFSGLSLLWRLGSIAVVLLGLWGGVALWKRSIYRQGWNAALQAVAQQNAVARETAKKVEGESNRCFDDGGEWNVSTGTCDR